MKSSLRAKRMARNHKKQDSQPKLNLVSLMDIFTILVFFLMVNSGDVEVLSSDKNITLPSSIAEKRPVLSLTIKISDTAVILQGRSLGEAFSTDDTVNEVTLNKLAEELQYQSARRSELTEKEQKLGRSVIIMGDENMPYMLLKKIMITCASNEYRDISLAVNHVESINNIDENTTNNGSQLPQAEG